MAHAKKEPTEKNSITIEGGVIDKSVPTPAPKDDSPVYHRPALRLENPAITKPNPASSNDPIAFPPGVSSHAPLDNASMETPTEPAWLHIVAPNGVHLQIHPDDLAEAMNRLPGLKEMANG